MRLQAQQPTGPAVTFRGHPDEVAEAAAVAADVRRLADQGVPWSEMAVLFRINAQSEAHEEALTGRGIPYVVRGAARFFDRPEVRQAVTLLRGTARGGEGGGDLVEAVRATLASIGWTHSPRGAGQVRDRWESWQALVDQATEFAAASAEADLGGFVDDLDRRASEQHAPVADGVTLTTLHAAKGLEWDAVFVTGVQDGTLPISMADGPTEIEEERRLLYVGMTRARRSLSVSWAQARNPGGRASRKPSRFLDALLPPGERDRAPTTGRRKAVHCRECGKPVSSPVEKKVGRCTDCPASYDEELFERLRDWRRTRAGDDEVPAYVVFTDATLQLIAEHKPGDEQALLRISGVGRSKLDKYGDEVLALLS